MTLRRALAAREALTLQLALAAREALTLQLALAAREALTLQLALAALEVALKEELEDNGAEVQGAACAARRPGRMCLLHPLC